jgi:hypothetical protein
MRLPIGLKPVGLVQGAQRLLVPVRAEIGGGKRILPPIGVRPFGRGLFAQPNDRRPVGDRLGILDQGENQNAGDPWIAGSTENFQKAIARATESRGSVGLSDHDGPEVSGPNIARTQLEDSAERGGPVPITVHGKLPAPGHEEFQIVATQPVDLGKSGGGRAGLVVRSEESTGTDLQQPISRSVRRQYKAREWHWNEKLE